MNGDMFKQYSNSLKSMVQRLIANDGVVVLPFKAILDSFNNYGISYALGGGKTVELIKKEKSEIIIRCVMKAGDYYSPNVHPDADEIVTVVYGKLRNDNFRMTKESMGSFQWKAGTPHELTAITDCLFYAKITKV